MIEKLKKLKAAFNDSLKAALVNITLEKIEEILNNRDSSEFSDAWMKAYHAVDGKEIDEETEDTVMHIRKEIFISIFKATSSSELPAYISDDFGLISSYYIHDIENSWVTNLLFTYLNHQIPQGDLMDTEKTINELIQ
ncbi:Uncharacterised protein [Chryseobacterium nakagawai]|uniref:Uncharacterized protein n=1 Tax=Chryseobacterium nakagawai TaxID=1241982 RepID=A0AAD0YMW9_CHRNA|nr:hypothetical protein [Chryseobacterium nakagawai]AZA90713.1 hypothetical protein EG343_08780 [Chryseobacterium nakagawai]VEH22237.1 Uncharacterised protein [Chryseobacterium nakagawai]